MNYDWVEVDGLYSQVGWRKRPKATKAIVIIPGNPGLARFYEDFANHLHENIPNANTFIFSNLGAVSGGQTNLFQNKEKFLLFGQIEHKRRLIEKMIDSDLEIIMVRVSTRPRKTFKIFIDYKKPIDQNNGRDKHMMILSFE